MKGSLAYVHLLSVPKALVWWKSMCMHMTVPLSPISTASWNFVPLFPPVLDAFCSVLMRSMLSMRLMKCSVKDVHYFMDLNVWTWAKESQQLVLNASCFKSESYVCGSTGISRFKSWSDQENDSCASVSMWPLATSHSHPKSSLWESIFWSSTCNSIFFKHNYVTN